MPEAQELLQDIKRQFGESIIREAVRPPRKAPGRRKEWTLEKLLANYTEVSARKIAYGETTADACRRLAPTGVVPDTIVRRYGEYVAIYNGLPISERPLVDGKVWERAENLKADRAVRRASWRE